MELDQVIQNIRHLTQKTVTKGCTEAEAISAATKIGELLKVYNLSMSQVFLDNNKCVTRVIKTGRQRKHTIDGCIVAMAEFCDCKVWLSKPYMGGGKYALEYNFFGMESDVDMLLYLYSIVLDAIDSETSVFKLSDTYRCSTIHRKSISHSFQKGMTGRISIRLRKMREQRHEEEEKESHPILLGQGTSMVLVKRHKVEDEFEELDLYFVKGAPKSNRIRSWDAYESGKQAGDRVNINRPLHRGVVKGLLT